MRERREYAGKVIEVGKFSLKSKILGTCENFVGRVLLTGMMLGLISEIMGLLVSLKIIICLRVSFISSFRRIGFGDGRCGVDYVWEVFVCVVIVGNFMGYEVLSAKVLFLDYGRGGWRVLYSV